jgi:hypothetical protein
MAQERHLENILHRYMKNKKPMKIIALRNKNTTTS